MSYFFHSEKIALLQTDNPISFFHRFNYDDPKNHNLHINNYIEIYVFISGDTDYVVQDSFYSLKYGDIIIINPQQVHKAVLRNKCDYERFYMLIPTTTFDNFAYNPIKRILNRSDGSSSLISLPPEQRKKALDLIFQISSICQKHPDDANKMLAFSYLIEFLCLLDQNLGHLQKSDLAITHTPKILSEVLVYIGQNLPYINSASEVANHFNITLPYLSTIFKKYVGTSIKIYIRTQRIALAKTLLNGDASVTDACYNSGFNDCSYFIKHFKNCIGMTPLQYKLQNVSQNKSVERKENK